MFVRKKPNKSGSVSVQIVAKTRTRGQRVIKSIGCSSDPKEIERLVADAHEYIASHYEPFLPGIDEDEVGFERFIGGLNNSQIQVVGPELVFGKLYDRIGYNQIADDMFRHMVICRLFNPGSKLKTVDYLERYLHVRVSLSKVYCFLDNLCHRPKPERSGNDVSVLVKENGEHHVNRNAKPDYKALVEQISYNHTRRVERPDGGRLVIYCSEKRASKDRRNREKGLARLQKRIRTGKLTKESINSRGYNKYLKLEGEMNVSVDLEKFNPHCMRV